MKIARIAPELDRMEVDELPDLDTAVAVAGSSRHQEVGGVLCMGIAAGVAIYVAT